MPFFFFNQVKGFANAKFKSFSSEADARTFVEENGNKNNENSKKRQKLDNASSLSATTSSSLSSSPYVKGNPDHWRLMFHVNFDGGSRGNPGIVAGSGAEIRIIRGWTTVLNNSINSKAAAPSSVASRKRPMAVVPKKRHHQQLLQKIQLRAFMGKELNNSRQPRRNHGGYTNNEAEYYGLQTAVEWISNYLLKPNNELLSLDNEHHPPLPTAADQQSVSSTSEQTPREYVYVKLLIQGDSQLILRQVDGEYACKSEKLQPYYRHCRQLLQREIHNSLRKNYPHCLLQQVILEHVPRKDNSNADGMYQINIGSISGNKLVGNYFL